MFVLKFMAQKKNVILNFLENDDFFRNSVESSEFVNSVT